MELVKLTHENIEQEHICCAISNNKDIQVMSKKNWLEDRLDEGLVFLKGMFGGNVLLSTYLHNMPGHPLRQKDICILDAQNAPSPFTTFSLFYDGQFVTHEILSEKKFDKILVSKGL